nr:Putative Peptide (Thyrotropin-releasing hormone-like) G protein-coupled receptor [Hymenolepis microstoma]
MNANMSTVAPLTFIASQFEMVPPARYYAFSYRILGTIAASLVLAVGITGNILVITVTMWSSKMRSPTNCYLVSLSFSDLLFLLHAAAPLIFELYVMINQWTFGDLACRIMIAMQYLSVDASILSMAAFSVERWVAICHPMRAQTLCTVNRALKIIAGIWIFSAAYNSVWLFTVTTEIKYYLQGTYTTCTYKYARGRYLIVYLLDLILFYAIPLCLIFPMYIQITSRLFTFHKSLWFNPIKKKLDGEGTRATSLPRRAHSILRGYTNEQAGQSGMNRAGSRQVRSRKQFEFWKTVTDPPAPGSIICVDPSGSEKDSWSWR